LQYPPEIFPTFEASSYSQITMKAVFQYIITKSLKRQLTRKGQTLSKEQFEKELKNSKIEFGHVVRDSLLILAGSGMVFK
jgi:hypothetical protein